MNSSYGMLDDGELEEYVDRFETLLGRKLEPGRGSAVPLRLTVDRVNMLHRPLLWYLVSIHVLDRSSVTCKLIVRESAFLSWTRSHSFICSFIPSTFTV